MNDQIAKRISDSLNEIERQLIIMNKHLQALVAAKRQK